MPRVSNPQYFQITNWIKIYKFTDLRRLLNPIIEFIREIGRRRTETLEDEPVGSCVWKTERKENEEKKERERDAEKVMNVYIENENEM